MPRSPSRTARPSRSRASGGTIVEDAYYEEIADLLRTMPSDWRRQYRSGKDKLAAIGGPALPAGTSATTSPSPEQAMLLIGITAGGNPSGDTPYGPHRVPRAVREAAMQGIRLSHANNYGAWDFIGLARAIELVIVPSVSDTTYKRMGKYLFRHKKDASAPGFGDDANPSRGYMAWLNWGGDPAVSWTRAFERNPRLRRNGTFGKYTSSWTGNDVWELLPGVEDPASLVVGPGEAFLDVWGTPGTTYWTEEAVAALKREGRPELSGDFATIEDIYEAVFEALTDSWDDNGVARTLAPAKGGALKQLANRVPIYRMFHRMLPFSIGYISDSLWAGGHGLQNAAHGDGSPREAMLSARPAPFRFEVGEPVYEMSSYAAWVPNAQHPHPLGTVAENGYTPDGKIVEVRLRHGGLEGYFESNLHRYTELPLQIQRVVPDPNVQVPAPSQPARTGRAARSVSEAIARIQQEDIDPNLTLAPRKVEALSEKSLTAKKGKLPSRAIAVVTPVKDARFDLYVTLLDPGVVRRKRITGQDILGHVSVDIEQSGDGTIGVAAAEPGYGYLLYATAATLLGEVARYRRGPGASASLRGSYSQTKYAKRFWSRQPGGSLEPLSEADFRRQFGTTYASLTQKGDRLAQRVAKAYGLPLPEAYRDIRMKGTNYFSDYYSVSSRASVVGPSLVPRPASPRESVAAFQRRKTRRPVERNFALVMSEVYSGSRLPDTYLVEVPRGASTFQPENVLARIAGDDSSIYRNVEIFGQFDIDYYAGEAYVVDIRNRLRALFKEVETPANRRKHERMLRRGEALKASLRQAGFTGNQDINNFFSYLGQAASTYAGRAREIEQDAPLLVANPRRFPLSVPIFMPV